MVDIVNKELMKNMELLAREVEKLTLEKKLLKTEHDRFVIEYFEAQGTIKMLKQHISDQIAFMTMSDTDKFKHLAETYFEMKSDISTLKTEMSKLSTRTIDLETKLQKPKVQFLS